LRKTGIPNNFGIILTKFFVFVNIFAKRKKFSGKYTVPFPNIVMPWLSCQGYLSSRLVQSDMPRLSCLSYLVPDVLSCPSCPVPAVLSQLSCSSCPAQAILSTAVLKPLLFPSSPVLSALPGSPHQADLSDGLVQKVLSWLSCLSCPVRVVLSKISNPNCHDCLIPVVQS
jgi:hypothetical protein